VRATARYPDFWADRRTGPTFRPGRVASGQRAAWVLDMWLPVLVGVEPSTYAVSDPIPLPRPPDGALDIIALAAGEGAVWGLWPDGLVRVEEATGSPSSIMVPIEAGMRSIAVGGEAAWVLAGGKIARVDAQSGRAELLLDQAERTFALGFGRGYLWTLSRRDPFTNQHTVLARYSPDSPERPARLDVEGAVEGLAIGSDAVWMRCHRFDEDGELHTFVIRVSPETLDTAVHEISNDETVFAIAREIWLSPTLVTFTHDPGPLTDIRRVDPSTWHDLGVIRPQGLVSDLSAGSSGIWGLLRTTPGSAPDVCQIDPNTSSVVAVLDFVDVDARSFLPAPPAPIDPEPVERALRDDLARALRLGRPSPEYNRGTMLESVVFDEVQLEGTFPKSEVIVLFRSDYRPELRFGHRERIWSDDGVYVTDGSGVIATNLEETIIFEPGLPLDAEPDATGVIWV
jgi:hypothetical protein